MATTDSMVDVGGNPDSWLPAIESLKKMLPAIIGHWKVCTSQTCACTSAAPELESAFKEVRRKDRALARAFVASEDDETVSEAAGSEADDEKSSEAEEETGKKKKKKAKKSNRAGSKRKRNDDDDDGKEEEDDDEKTAPEEEDGRQKKARKTANTSSAPESQNESESDGKVDAPAPPSSPPAAAAAAAAAAAPKSPTKPRKKPLATAKDVTEYPFLLSVNEVMKSFEVSNDTQTSALLKQVIGIASSAQQQPTDPKDVLKNVSQLAPVVEHDPQRKLTTSGTLAHQCAAYEELVKTDQERGARVHERLLKDTVSRKAAMDTTLTADAQAFVQSVRDQNSKTKWHNLQKTGRLFLAHPVLMRCDATVYPWTFFCREADNILKLMDALKASDSAKYASVFEQPNAA